MNEWKSTSSRPEVKKYVILLTDNGQIMRGYMNETVFPGETKPTYSFHGEYIDFERGKRIFCLVNAIGWIAIPELPKVEL